MEVGDSPSVSLGPITDPYYRLLIDLLADRTGTPLSLAVFRDVFLPVYDPTGHLATLVQFNQWYVTYRGYFFALPEVQQYRSPPPEQLSNKPSMESNQEDEFTLQEPLPYRTEVDCALAHYLSSGKFSDAVRIRTTSVAKSTTHPDIFIPMINEMHFVLLPAAKAFLTYASNNLSPMSRIVRILVSLLAMLVGVIVLIFCAINYASLWWRVIPLPWMSVALFYLVAAVFKLDGMRAMFNLTERGLVEDWVTVAGSEKRPRRHKIVMVEDEWVKEKQNLRLKWVIGIWVVGLVVMWCLALAL